MEQYFDVIIIGGSYAGLSAGMALGRSLRKVLIIDSGKPCNRQTPHSHNFLTQDGKAPGEISDLAKDQVLKYKTVQFHEDTVVNILQQPSNFEVLTDGGDKLYAQKIILASGVKDKIPDIPGFAECWGISVIHCPYCHGYEVHGKTTGILSNGNLAFDFTKIVYNLTKDLKLFTNGPSDLSGEQAEKFSLNRIEVIEDEIQRLEHKNGHLTNIILKNGKNILLDALYAKIPFEQNVSFESLKLEMTEHGLIKTDHFYKTNIDGIFACGDSTTMMRSVSNAVAQGNFTGAVVNRELAQENF